MFAKKTVDSVLASFRKTVKDLDAVHMALCAEAGRQTDRIEAARSEIEQAEIARDVVLEEANRAMSIAGKIEALIS